MMFLVSCVSGKLTRRAPAKDLYITPWFQKARAYVEAQEKPWFILSAKHGLLTPERVIAPYDVTLNRLNAAERRRWASKVVGQLDRAGVAGRDITVLAGERYRQFLVPQLEVSGVRVHVPMQGLGIGRQLQWLGKARTQDAASIPLRRFYEILDHLSEKTGGFRLLRDAHGRMLWPSHGVYFFFEPGELRAGSGRGLRVVRVGTHALSATSDARLWSRLRQHRGTSSGRGHHRGSIFRLLVGNALHAKQGLPLGSWGTGSSRGTAARRLGITSAKVRDSEAAMEQLVSATIREMPLLCLPLGGRGDATHGRGYVERNAIALLSNRGSRTLDPPSRGWLGHHCDRQRVRDSGLWNQNHVGEHYDANFLDVLEDIVARLPVMTS